MSSEGKPRVVLDTNIYISALIFGGKPEKIFFLATENKIELIVSPAIISEVAKVLSQKFKWRDESVLAALQSIKEIARFVYPKQRLSIIKYKTDNMFLEAAVEAKADFIISGDKKHILPLKKFGDVKIITADEFLVEYERR
ncbi:MAG: putative toxin-antitoxin system toxin component, PIN family [Candidatus Woykebacteria bacterium]